ncbi:MAG: GAF domain-containing protein [Hyphomicrobiales bacterium]|nr:MAG: GAF domain-containing protein [Hyphomicrobiales bacterium]
MRNRTHNSQQRERHGNSPKWLYRKATCYQDGLQVWQAPIFEPSSGPLGSDAPCAARTRETKLKCAPNPHHSRFRRCANRRLAEFRSKPSLSMPPTTNQPHPTTARDLDSTIEQLERMLSSSMLEAQPDGQPDGWLGDALTASGIGLYTLDVRQQVLYPTSGFCDLFGLPHERSFPIASIDALVLKEDKQLASNDLSRSDGLYSRQTVYRIRRHDNSAIRSLEQRASDPRLNTVDGKTFIIGAVRDISEQTEAQARERQRQSELEAFARSREFVIGLTARQRAQTDPDAVMRLTSDALGKWLGADRVGFYRVLNADTVQYLNGWSGISLSILSGTFDRVANGILAAQRVETGQPLVFADSRHDEAGALAPFSELGALSGIVVPIRSNERWHAGIYVHHAAVRSWTPAETEMVREISELTWLAVERAEAVMRLNDRLDRQQEQIAKGLADNVVQKDGRAAPSPRYGSSRKWKLWVN